MTRTHDRAASPSRRVLTVLVALAVLVTPALVSSPAQAADLTIELGGPKSARSGTMATLTGEVAPAEADRPVTVQVRRSGSWQRLGEVRTDAQGSFTRRFRVQLGANTFRAVAQDLGDPVRRAPWTVEGVRAAGRVSLDGKHQVVDEKTRTLTVRWRTSDGRRLTGKVLIHRKIKGTSRWLRGRSVRVSGGVGRFAVSPRRDTYYRATSPQTWVVRGDRSPRFLLDNRPPGKRVVLPSGAPRPTVRTKTQPRAVGAGANARIMPIPGRVWRSMKGRSWHRGCPVGRSSLRRVLVNYWGFDGYRHRGTLVVNASIAGRTRAVFRGIYRARLPIRSIIRVDHFGWSNRVHGANDYRSMRADNTSAFNCRSVVGKPSVRSPHAVGRSIDVNTWENPYRSARGLVPNAWWDRRSKPYRVAYRSGSHPIVKIFRRHGFSWLGSSDWQHFQYNGSGKRDLDRHEGLFLD